MCPYCHEFWRSIPNLCWATYKMNSNEPVYCSFHKGQLAVGPSPLLSFVTPHRWSFNPLNHPSCWCLRKGSLRHERWVVNGNTWVVSRNTWAMMPNLVNGHGLRYIFLNWHLHFWKFQLWNTHILIEQEWREPITMSTFKNYQCITNFNYKNPYKYMSLTRILKHVIEHNTWNITHFTTFANSSSHVTLL